MLLGRLERNSVPFSFLASQTSYEEARYVVVGVPYDGTSSWAPGSRFGPLAIIDASRYMDPFDLDLGCTPLEAGIHTVPEISVLELAPTDMVGIVGEIAREVRDDGKIPVLLGGEHTISLGGISGLRDHVDVLIVLDAHADLYDEFEGRKVCHATVARRASEIVDEVVICGVRTMGWEEQEELSKVGNVTLIRAPVKEALGEISRKVRGRRAYLSLDVDVLDPPQVPCVGTPEPGGLDYSEVLILIKEIMREGNVVAMDFVEFSPCPGMRSDAYLVAKLVYKAIGYHISYSGEDDLGCHPDE